MPDDEIIDMELVPEPEIVEAQIVHEYLDPPRTPAGGQFPYREPSSPQPINPIFGHDEALTLGTADTQGPWSELLLNSLLSPRSIRWLFVLGGGLMVLGLVIWLASLGVFGDPRLIAGLLSAGSLAVHLTGVLVSMRTQQKMVGQALTFLGCVLLPLNLWYYHAQGLVMLDGWLWLGGVACCVLYLITVIVLRDPLFIYAVEAGVTLTAVLILGTLGLIDQSPAFTILFLVLATVSIHTERLFVSANEKTREFGLPFFWSGQVQLAAAMVVLTVVQMLSWILVPLQEIGHWNWSGNLLTESPLLTAGLWCLGAYLYFYSDLVVRKVGVYVVAGAFCLLMTEFTLAAAGEWKLEWRMALLSTTSLAVSAAFFFLGRRNEVASRLLSPIVLLLSIPSVLLGLLLHFRATSKVAEMLGLDYETSWEFLVVMLWSAICARVCAALFAKTHGTISAVFMFLSAAGVMAAFAGLLRMLGLIDWVHQAPLLMAIPIGYIIAYRVERGRAAELPLFWISHAGAGLILVASILASVADFGSRLEELQFLQGSTKNLLLAVVFAEGVLFYLLAARFRQRGANTGLAAAAAAASAWQIFVYLHMPWELFGPLFALLGLSLVIAGRMRGVTDEPRYTAQGTEYLVHAGPGRLLHDIGNGIFAFAWLACWFGCVIAYLEYAADLRWRPVAALSFCVALAISAIVVSLPRVWRYVHASAAAILLCTMVFQLYLLLEFKPWQVLEYSLLVLGIVLLITSHVGRVFEKPDEPNELVTVGLVFGSLFAAAPLFVGVVVHRYFMDGAFLPDELGFVTVAAMMVVAGVVLHTRVPVGIGGLSICAYAVILLISIAYIPQIAIGVYLALGGGLLFSSALLLSVYRERIIRIPERYAKREGIFKVLLWR
jgi:hypothetical protein